MPVMDEFREERDSIKNASLKEKWDYFWEYYKWYVIGGAIIIALLIIFIRDILNNKDWIFYGAFINAYSIEEEADSLVNDFAALAELDTENYAVMIDSSYSITLGSSDQISSAAIQKLMVNMSAADVDFIAADATTFVQYATTDTFFDIRTILSEEQIEKYEPYFYYVDMEEIRRVDQANYEAVFENYLPKDYDHTSPEGLEDPVPVALYINSSEKLQQSYLFTEEEVVLGIPLNTKHLDTSLQFIDYLME